MRAAAAKKFGHTLELTEGLLGGIAIHKTGSPFPEETKKLALAADATLMGAVGLPEFDAAPPSQRPEAGLLGIRAVLDVYANLRQRILLAQVKDARRTPGSDGDEWQLVLLGEGEVPVRQMLGLLEAGGYRRWISVEWEKRWHPELAAPEIALPRDVRILRRWLAGSTV